MLLSAAQLNPAMWNLSSLDCNVSDGIEQGCNAAESSIDTVSDVGVLSSY